jgi:long-chain acyl-CoA synthetase
LEGLAGVVGRLRKAKTPHARHEHARALVGAAQPQSRETVDLGLLIEAADALLETYDSVEEAHRPALGTLAHEFIDLARSNAIRRAAYPSEGDRPGARWLARIIELIERTNFTVGRMMRQRAAVYPDRTLFVVPRGEGVKRYSWSEVMETTERVARGILGVLGEDPVVAVYTPNRIEGVLVDLACLSNGIFNTLVPANSVDSQLRHILVESGARMLVVAGAQQVTRSIAALEDLGSLEWVVTLDALPHVPGANLMTLEDLMRRGDKVSGSALHERLAAVRSTDVATTMYTSGTTGTPKGIKFTHVNLVSKRYARVAALPDIDQNEVFVCYLPLYHTFGRYLEMLGAAHLAATYVLAENASTETLVSHMKRFKPTAMISVPKKWLDLHDRIIAADVPLDDPEQVRQAIRETTGGCLRWGLSAAGRLDPAIFRFYQNHGVDLLSGYGMTEATGGVTMTPPGWKADGSIGRALPAIELSLGEDNELLLRGPYVTPGYTNPEDAAACFKDGWFYTGDIVSKNPAGYYQHVDRKKDIYKNASGRTIAPQRVEALFADFPEVSRVFAVGDGREFVTLLIRPNEDCAEVRFKDMSAAALHEYFRALVVSCNRFLAPFERVVNFALIDRDFSLEKDELTPKGSFRRSVVEDHFRDVVEKLYVSSTIDRVIDGLRVQVPIAFLQHLGATERGTEVVEDGLFFRATGTRLRVQRDPHAEDRVWIGNCCYEGLRGIINLDEWLRLPHLWVGNAELTRLTGEDILLWSLTGGDRRAPARMVGVTRPEFPIDEWRTRLEEPRDAAPSLLTVHAAAVVLSGGTLETSLSAVDRLLHTMAAGRARYQELAQTRLQYASTHPERAVRSRAFVALFKHQQPDALATTARLFCQSHLDFLDEEACTEIASLGVKPAQWRSMAQAFASLRRSIHRDCSAKVRAFIMKLLGSLGKVAELEDDFYLPVRRELMAWMLAPVPEAIREHAEEIADRLAEGLRQGLGNKQEEAIDPGTGRRYTWADTFLLEEGMDPGRQVRVTQALLQTELIREAVFVLHHERRIDLEDVAPGNIWISVVETRFGRTMYHVGLRLRNLERCDFAIHLLSTTTTQAMLTDLRLMCVAAGELSEPPLTPELGGFWPEYQIATVEHIPGESVETMALHMHRHPDKDTQQRLKRTWKHLSWSTLTAALEFYRRTEGQWMLTGSIARDICVPLNDFEETARIVSAAGWQPFAGTLELLLRLKRGFLDRVRFHFPALAPETENELLFAAVLESLGLREGLAFLEDAMAKADDDGKIDAGQTSFREELRSFIARIHEDGYMPRSLYFAIRRYDVWAQQVPDAGVHARAAQLRELEKNYRIPATAQKFPGSRLWLYAETVLKDSPDEGKVIIRHAIRRLREGGDIKEVLGRLYADLQEKLPSHDQHYFLTRAAYPHLEPDEKAELVTTSEVDVGRAELVTAHTDQTGRELRIRPVADSRELDTLHRIFYTGGIGGGLTASENFLVSVDRGGYVVGGVAFIRRTPHHVILDKIAVLPRCRGRGIGRILLQEFLRRQRAEGVTIVSAEFIRASWLSQFGFASHPRYAGVVLPLADVSREQPVATT